MARLLWIGILVAACGVFSEISRDEAISIASQHTGLQDPVLVDAEVKAARAIEWHGPAPEGRLWIVRFRGIATACGPAPPPGDPPNPCLDQVSESSVYLDYETGAFISTGTGPIP